jgi:gliding motility-associated-like protein
MKKVSFLFLLLALKFNPLFGQNSLFLPGPTNYVRVGDLDVAGNQLTVEALIHYTGASINIVSKHTDPSNVNYLLRIGSFEITTTSGFANFGGVAAAGVTLVAGRTYHVAATYNGQFLRYYVNGCLTGEMPWTGNMITNNLQTAIGNQSTTQTEQFTGYIDEVRIWNVARTQAQIAANMLDLPNPTTQAGLLGYYKFDGNYINAQGNAAFNGVAVGAPQFQRIPYPYPTTLGVTATSSPTVCNNTSTGAIDIAGNGGYLPYTYSIDGVNFFPSPQFSDVLAGNYTVYARSNANCVATTNITVQNNPILQTNLNTSSISCPGGTNGSAVISPTGGNGPNYGHEWSTGNTTDFTLSNLPPGNYSVSVTDSCKMSGNELVTNGHFENGTTGFTTDYVNCTNCFSASNDLPGGNYVVSYNANIHHGAFQGLGRGGSGNFMIINGSATPNTNVWCQTIPVNPNTYYVFSSWVASVHPSSPAQLQFWVNGQLLGPTFNAPGTTNTWNQFFSTWNSGAQTTATICIVNQNVSPGGNDFALDDISFKECVSCVMTEPFVITEPDPLQLTTDLVDELCNGQNGSITIQATGGSAPYWYSIDGGLIFGNSNEFNNLEAGNYSIVVRDNNNCETTTTVSLLAVGQAQVDAGLDQTICQGESVTLTATGAFTYVWSGGITNGTPFNPATTQMYTVTGTDQFGCVATDDVTVTVLPLPNVTAGQDVELCFGGSVTLTGDGADNYVWNNGVLNGVEFTPATTLVYEVTGTDQFGCEATDLVTVTVHPLPNVSAGQDKTICMGDEVTLLATGANGYTWSDGVQNNVPFVPNQTTTYSVIGTDQFGCSSNAEVTITVLNLPTVSAGNNQTICIGESVILAASGAENYFWTGGVTDGLAFTPNTTQVYTVTGIDEFGCQSTDQVTVTVHPLPNISAGSDSQLCEGQPVILSGQGGVSYTWNQGVTNGQPFVQQVGSVTYTVTGTDANGCVNTDQVVVTVNPLPNTSFSLLNNKGCAPLEPTFINTTPGNNQQNCTWNFGNGTTGSGCLTTSAIYSTSGCYNVTLAVTSNQGCTQSFTLNDIVCVDEQPVAQFAANPLTMSTINPEVTVINLSENAVTYQWEFGDNSGQYTQESLAHTYEEAGVYIISLFAFSENGCVDSTFQTVLVEEELLFFIPNAFTPGGDKFNETFQPVFTSGFDPSRFNMILFNRWGEIVFETNNAAIGWDGTYGGKPAPEGTYIWQVKLDNVTFDKPQIYRGHFSLLR